MERKIKTFKMDPETEAKLVALAEEDERSQSGEVRFLIATEYERRVQLPRGTARKAETETA